MDARFMADLAELVAIPSVSADPARAAAVHDAARWVGEHVAAGGATSEVLSWNGHPLVVADLPASHAGPAPTVLLYGHVDVQPEGPRELWASDPFTLEVRDEWAYARGVADDKGGLLMLLRAALDLAADGALPVNVRVLCDGEEETLGTSVTEYLAADPAPADACLIYDMDMVTRDQTAFSIGTRGNVTGELTVRTNARDLHSGGSGGAAMNAITALAAALSGVRAVDGVLPDDLRAGIIGPSVEELAAFAALPTGAELLARSGALAADPDAAADYHRRVRLEPTVEVTGIVGGSPDLAKTIIPAEARARISARLAAGQDPEAIRAAIERRLRAAAPAGADVRCDWSSATPPSLFPTATPALQLARDAFGAALGRAPLFVRAGGSLPIMPALQQLGVPTVLTGFALAESNVHAPDERMLVSSFARGIAAAKETLVALARLPR